MYVCAKHVNVLVNKQYQMTVILFRFLHNTYNCREHIHAYVYEIEEEKKNMQFLVVNNIIFSYIHAYVYVLELQYFKNNNNNNLKEAKQNEINIKSVYMLIVYAIILQWKLPFVFRKQCKRMEN